MKTATEEFLYFLLWTAEALTYPAWRNVQQSFESCAYANNLNRRLRYLERQKLIERHPSERDSSRLYRLTEAGRLAALGGINPPSRWSRPWDGKWRLVLFDVSEVDSPHRMRLRRVLRRFGFGYLQDSAWISPDPPNELTAIASTAKADVEMLVMFQGDLAGGETNADLVSGAWNFEAISKTYEQWNRIADTGSLLPSAQRPETIKAWAATERATWAQVCRRDPFLPSILLPAGYPGRKAWARRVQLLNQLGVAFR